MKRFEINFICPACSTGNKVRFHRAPKRFSPIPIKVTCDECESRFLLSIEKGHGLERNAVQYTHTLLFISERAKDLVTQRQKEQATSGKI